MNKKLKIRMFLQFYESYNYMVEKSVKRALQIAEIIL